MCHLRQHPLIPRIIANIHRSTPITKESNRSTQINTPSKDIRKHAPDGLGRNLSNIRRPNHNRHTDPQTCNKPARKDLSHVTVAHDHDDEAHEPEHAEDLQCAHAAEGVAYEEGEQGADDAAKLDHGGYVGEDVGLVGFGAVCYVEFGGEGGHGYHAAD